MIVNSELHSINPEWDSEDMKPHLPFCVFPPKDTETQERSQSYFNRVQESKAIHFLVAVGGDHIWAWSRGSAQPQDKQTGQ